MGGRVLVEMQPTRPVTRDRIATQAIARHSGVSGDTGETGD